MSNLNPAATAWRPEYVIDPDAVETGASGVSWAAVITGGFVAAAFALILAFLGAGLGLTAISPWAGAGITASKLGIAAIMWIVVTQLLAYGIGGYLAGRLRTKWSVIHNDEVYFRDTAHGLLVWALGVVVTAAFLGSAASSILAGAAKLTAGTAAAGAAAMSAPPATNNAAATPRPAGDAGNATVLLPQEAAAVGGGYYTDALVRGNATSTSASPATRQELGRILAEALRTGRLTDTDRTYVAQVVATQTGLSQVDAEKRVDAIYAQAKSAAADAELAALTTADNARKAAAWTSLWIFVALLIGAFCASFAATVGGRQRDRVATRVGAAAN